MSCSGGDYEVTSASGAARPSVGAWLGKGLGAGTWLGCLSEELKGQQEGHIAWKTLVRFLLSGEMTGHRKADGCGCLCEGWFLRCWNFPWSWETECERKLPRN